MLPTVRQLLLSPQRYSARQGAERWAGAVVQNGGTVSDGRLTLVTTLIGRLMACGSWWLTDDLWMLVAENEAQALTSLKQRRLGATTATPTFTADAGYAFNGTTQYIDTGFIASSHAIALTRTSSRIGVYERTNVAANTYAIGAINNSAVAWQLRPRNSGSTCLGNAGSQAATFTLPAADSRGMLTVSRNGFAAADVKGFKNGALIARAADPGAYGLSLTIRSLLIGCYSNNGTPAGFRASTIGYACIGAALTDTLQEEADYAAVQAHMTSLGANV